VPATAFCEPDEGKPANWHWFALKGDDERPLFAFPGIYRQWKGPIKKDGPNVDIEVFSFMTTLPNALTETINQERSPVIFTEEEQFATSLQGTPEEAFGLIKTSTACRSCSRGSTRRTCCRPRRHCARRCERRPASTWVHEVQAPTPFP
jgi:putative SOS response-associated peptidase YedK